MTRQTIIRICPKDLGLFYDEVEQGARLRLRRALESEREISEPASSLYRIALTVRPSAGRRSKDQLELSRCPAVAGRRAGDAALMTRLSFPAEPLPAEISQQIF
jgi:hypothetical protein